MTWCPADVYLLTQHTFRIRFCNNLVVTIFTAIPIEILHSNYCLISFYSIVDLCVQQHSNISKDSTLVNGERLRSYRRSKMEAHRKLKFSSSTEWGLWRGFPLLLLWTHPLAVITKLFPVKPSILENQSFCLVTVYYQVSVWTFKLGRSWIGIPSGQPMGGGTSWRHVSVLLPWLLAEVLWIPLLCLLKIIDPQESMLPIYSIFDLAIMNACVVPLHIRNTDGLWVLFYQSKLIFGSWFVGGWYIEILMVHLQLPTAASTRCGYHWPNQSSLPCFTLPGSVFDVICIPRICSCFYAGRTNESVKRVFSFTRKWLSLRATLYCVPRISNGRTICLPTSQAMVRNRS